MFLRIGIFYVLTWFFLILFGGIQEATGILPPQIGLAQWGPGVAALLMLVIFRKDGIKITFFSKVTPVLRYLWAALIPTGVGLLVYLIRTVLTIPSATPPDTFNQMSLILMWTPLGALGEEIGWRGYLHKKLDTRMRGLFSSILVGLLWLPIHFFAFASAGPVTIAFLALWFISLSVVIYGLVQDTGFSVLAATIFHLSINFINLLILDVYFNPTFWMINGIVWAIVATIFVITKRDIYLGAKQSML
jgi:membrane protease YdiL (CAAX protease family)